MTDSIRPQVEMTNNKHSPHALRNKLGRGLWGIVYILLFRPSPRPMFAWRRFLLRIFGAQLAKDTYVNNTTRIWAPWNLTMDRFSSLAHDVNCYCVAPIKIGTHVTVSQYSYLCAATHDFEDPHFPLRSEPIELGDHCWIAADVFLAPGTTVGQGAVVGARSSVFSDIPPWVVATGNPARPLRKRVMRRPQTD